MKDPAFLFYSKDFYEGTRMMLPVERSCYIDLLCYQHQHEYIPDDPERLLLYCSGINEATLKATLKAKFKLCDKGYYNEKLKEVMSDRAEFSSKQSINGIVGQFFKKSKAILDKKQYLQLRETFENQSNESIYNEVKDILKDEAMLKAMLEAKLKHLANGIAIENTIIDSNSLKDSKETFLNEQAVELNDWAKNHFHEKYVGNASLETFDKLLRIDKYTPDEIKQAITWARNDNFWSSNFISPLKLRSKDKNGVKYIDVFLTKILHNGINQTGNRGQQRDYNELAEILHKHANA